MGKCKRNAHKANINENIAKILTLQKNPDTKNYSRY